VKETGQPRASVSDMDGSEESDEPSSLNRGRGRGVARGMSPALPPGLAAGGVGLGRGYRLGGSGRGRGIGIPGGARAPKKKGPAAQGAPAGSAPAAVGAAAAALPPKKRPRLSEAKQTRARSQSLSFDPEAEALSGSAAAGVVRGHLKKHPSDSDDAVTVASVDDDSQVQLDQVMKKSLATMTPAELAEQQAFDDAIAKSKEEAEADERMKKEKFLEDMKQALALSIGSSSSERATAGSSSTGSSSSGASGGAAVTSGGSGGLLRGRRSSSAGGTPQFRLGPRQEESAGVQPRELVREESSEPESEPF
jgi:hypothetical protein